MLQMFDVAGWWMNVVESCRPFDEGGPPDIKHAKSRPNQPQFRGFWIYCPRLVFSSLIVPIMDVEDLGEMLKNDGTIAVFRGFKFEH